MNLTSTASALKPSPQPKISQQMAAQVVREMKADKDFVSAVKTQLHDAELEALNKSLQPCRRSNYRGLYAEAESISLLYNPLMSLGFEEQNIQNHIRFIHLSRYSLPVRVYVCRANKKKDGQFETWKKQKYSSLLVAENKDQLTMFEMLLTKNKKGVISEGEYNGGPILNVWIIADGSSEADKSKDDLAIYLVVPTDIKFGASFIARRLLQTLVEEQIFTGFLGAPFLLEAEKPKPQEITVDAPERRNEEEAS